MLCVNTDKQQKSSGYLLRTETGATVLMIVEVVVTVTDER